MYEPDGKISYYPTAVRLKMIFMWQICTYFVQIFYRDRLKMNEIKIRNGNAATTSEGYRHFCTPQLEN